jgi:asparagine synthase (glutamine-hydrolysing)
MASDDGSVVLIFNGEIYNFRELRGELAARGAAFRTTSDTEVILRAYEAWGVDCLPRLRGMFAFAVWDKARRRLFLARDRVGIKPLVYAWDGRRLLFASEIKALLEDPTLPRELDWEALRDFLTLHYIPSPRTIFRSIRKLPPPLSPPRPGSSGQIRRCWDLASSPTTGRPSRTAGGLASGRCGSQPSRDDVPIGPSERGWIESVVALMIGHGRPRADLLHRLRQRLHELEHARPSPFPRTQHFGVVKPTRSTRCPGSRGSSTASRGPSPCPRTTSQDRGST